MPRWGRGRGCVPSTKACPTNGRILAGICRSRPCRRSESAPRAPHRDPPVRVPKQTGAPIAPPARSHEVVARRWRALIVCWTHLPLTLQRRPPRRRWGLMKVSGTKKNARGGVGLASRSQDGRHVEKADPTTRNRPRKNAQEGGVSLKGRSLSFWTPARIGLLSRESKRGSNRAVRTGFLTSRPRSWRSISSTRLGTKQPQAGTSQSLAARPARPVRTVASHRRARKRATGANRQAGGNAAQSKEADICAALGPIGRS